VVKAAFGRTHLDSGSGFAGTTGAGRGLDICWIEQAAAVSGRVDIVLLL